MIDALVKIRALLVLKFLVIFMALAIVVCIYEAGKSTSLSCELLKAGYANCSSRTSWLRIIPIEEREIHGVQAARVSEFFCHDFDVCTQLELLTKGCSSPIPIRGIQLNEARVAKKDINDFLQGSMGEKLFIKGSLWLFYDRELISIFLYIALFGVALIFYAVQKIIRGAIKFTHKPSLIN